MCAGDLAVWPALVDKTAQLEASWCVLFEISEGLSALDHIRPISNDFGIRDRMPRYRLGRYGPHSNDALLCVDGPSDVIGNGNASIKAQNMSRMSCTMARYRQPCIFTSRAARDSNPLHHTYHITHFIVVRWRCQMFEQPPAWG